MTMIERRPLQLAVLLATSAGLYSASLAGIAALQSRADRATIAAREPTGRALDQLVADADRLQAALSRAATTYALAADRYESVGPGLEQTAAALAELQAAVTEVSGSVADLPTGITVPRLTRSTTVVTRTVVHATTGASGG